MRRHLPAICAALAVVLAILASPWLVPPGVQHFKSEPALEPLPDLDEERARLDLAVMFYKPTDAPDISGLEYSALPFFQSLPGVAHVDITQADGDGPTARIIHILDYHPVHPDLYDGTLPYAEHLKRVELIQLQQAALLTTLARHHGLKKVWQEGLTPETVKDWEREIGAMRIIRDLAAKVNPGGRKPGDDEGFAARMVQLGAPARLLIDGVLREALPLDDEKLLQASGGLDPAALEAREDYMVQEALKRGPVAVLLLGGSHDLTDNLERLAPSCEYVRVEPECWEQVSK